MAIGIGLLVVAISFSPRMPLPIFIPGRRFDLRIEDIILVGLLFFWLFYLSLRPHIYVTPLFKPLFLYLIVVAFTSGMAILFLFVSPIRPFFYFLKEFEYFLIFLLVANSIRTRSHVSKIGHLIIGAGIINALWVGFQFLTHHKSPLFILQAPEGVYQPRYLLWSYGPGLIGEISPLSTGGFFMLVFLFSLGYFFFLKTDCIKRGLYLVLSLVFFSCIVASASKICLIGSILGAGLLSFITGNKKLPVLFFSFLLLIITAVAFGSRYVQIPFYGGVGIGRIFFWEKYVSEIVNDRWPHIWRPLLPFGYERFFTGFGKGGTYFISDYHVEEAHNHYLTVFLESGFFGLVAFIWLLVKIITLAARVHRHSEFDICRVIAGTTLAATGGLIFGAFFHDIFKPVILNELWWIFIGLTAAAYRMEFPSSQENYV
jgi:hypothetical protein